jgi:hypothetical protein
MKVKLINFKEGENVLFTQDLTIGKVYDVAYFDDDGDAWIIDDAGDENNLYAGEFEVIDAE